MNNNSNKKFVIGIANQKGGVGKSTLAIHLLTYLINYFPYMKIAFIDLDVGQYTGYNFLLAREKTAEKMPIFYKKLNYSPHDSQKIRDEEESKMLKEAINNNEAQIVIIDTSGALNNYTKKTIEFSSLVITPMNVSMVDLGILCKTVNDKGMIEYGDFVNSVFKIINKKMSNLADNLNPADQFWKWVFVRNRKSHIYKDRAVDKLFNQIVEEVSGEIIGEIHDRVIFKRFSKGITICDAYRDYVSNLDKSSINGFKSIEKLCNNIMRFFYEWSKIQDKSLRNFSSYY